jgi:CHASE3 domain sensor protein
MEVNMVVPIDNEEYISQKDTLSRLVRLETKVCLKFEEMEKAIVLAREQIERDKELAKNDLDRRLASMNEFQKRMDKLEGTFATKDYVNDTIASINLRINSVEKLVFIGVGILISLQFIFHFFR